MIRVAALRMYQRRLHPPATADVTPPGIALAVWDSRLAAGGRVHWHPDADRRFGEGQACAVAGHGDEIVAYCWLATTPVRVAEIGHVVVPGEEDVYLYDAFTVETWRGRGLFTTLLLRLLAFAGARGRRRALIFALASNRASCRAIERAGFEVFRTAWRVRLGGLEHLWFRARGSGSSPVTLVAEGAR